MCYFCSLSNNDLYSSNADLSIGKILIGGTDHDVLIGTEGFDSIYGRAGDDLIDGGVGDDYLKGDDGADQFVLRRGDGRDTIFDFEDNVDKFLLKNSLTYDELKISQEYGRTVISITETGEVLADLLYEVDVNQIGSDDFIEFSNDVEDSNINSSLADNNENLELSTVLNGNNEPEKVRLEIENFNLESYEKEGNIFGIRNFPASGGELIKLNSEVSKGTATTEFTGLSGFYDVIVGYFDEKDGEAKLELEVNNTTVDSWILDENLPDTIANSKTFTKRIIENVELNTKDVLSVVGIRDQAEFARVDFLELIPSTQMEVGLGVGSQW